MLLLGYVSKIVSILLSKLSNTDTLLYYCKEGFHCMALSGGVCSQTDMTRKKEAAEPKTVTAFTDR